MYLLNLFTMGRMWLKDSFKVERSCYELKVYIPPDQLLYLGLRA